MLTKRSNIKSGTKQNYQCLSDNQSNKHDDHQPKMVHSQSHTVQTETHMADVHEPAGREDEQDGDGILPEDSSSNVKTKHHGSTASRGSSGIFQISEMMLNRG